MSENDLARRVRASRDAAAIGEPEIDPTELARAAAAELEGSEYANLSPGSAGAKIMRTIREISAPDSEAEELELGLASLAMGLEPVLAATLHEQTDERVDEFVLGLVRFVSLLRSDHSRELVVVELPRHPPHTELPAGTRLHMLDDAVKATREAKLPI